MSIKTACAEVGQGFVTLVEQIGRTEFGVDQVIIEQTDTLIGSAGSTSASRQTWMSGGAVKAACESVGAKIIGFVSAATGVATEALLIRDAQVVSLNGEIAISLVDVAPGKVFADTVEFHHAPTVRLDENGQGDAHVSFAVSAHRAVVDVDTGLGLIRVVEMATSQDVGRVVIAGLIEQPEPGAPYGAKGVGEPPAISSTPAIAAAIRQATGLELPRVPVRPQDIALAKRPR